MLRIAPYTGEALQLDGEVFSFSLQENAILIRIDRQKGFGRTETAGFFKKAHK